MGHLNEQKPILKTNLLHFSIVFTTCAAIPNPDLAKQYLRMPKSHSWCFLSLSLRKRTTTQLASLPGRIWKRMLTGQA